MGVITADLDKGPVQVHQSNVRTEFIEFQDAPLSQKLANSASLRSPSDPSEPTVDIVEVIKFGNVFDGI